MNRFFGRLAEGFKTVFSTRDLGDSGDQNKHSVVLINIRNVFVFAASLLFLVSLFSGEVASHTLRGIAYILGAVAYIFEILFLTDLFSIKAPHRELFMAYCFAPLYLIMGLFYFLHH